MSLYRLSHSALQTFHSCERLFQLDRTEASPEKQHSPATVLGTAFGVGAASYLVDQDIDKALFKAWMAYFPVLTDDKRSPEVCLNLLLASVPALDNLLQDWEVIYFDGKPAVELSFRLNLSSQFYYVGYVDLCLKNRWTGRAAVIDIKTTALNLFDLSPVYQNSDQCLSYSVVLDKIVGEQNAEYDVGYFVGQIGKNFSCTVKPYFFTKTLQDRLDWFVSLGLDVKHLEELVELQVFPRRGHSCLRFNKPCRHFGTCQLHSFDSPLDEIVQDSTEYQFTFQLEDLIQDHVARINF